MRNLLALIAAFFLVAAPAAAQGGPHLVGFAQNNAALSATERAELDAFATSIAMSDGSVIIAGHAAAGEANDVQLSNNRSNVVRDYLASRGVSTSRITTQAFGATRPVVAAGGAQNRRVEIIVGPASGW